MAKVVTFKAKDVLGQDFSVMDSTENVKRVSNGLKRIFSAMDKVDKDHPKNDQTVMDYSDAIVDAVIEDVADLLHLSKEDGKKLMGMSYSDVSGFYEKVANEFLGMQVPSVKKLQEALAGQTAPAEETGPKQKSAE